MAECKHEEGARCKLLGLSLGPRECIGVNEASCPLAVLAARADAAEAEVARLRQRVVRMEDDDEVMGRGARLRKLSEDHGVPVKELGGGLIAIDLKALGPKLGMEHPEEPEGAAEET